MFPAQLNYPVGFPGVFARGPMPMSPGIPSGVSLGGCPECAQQQRFMQMQLLMVMERMLQMLGSMMGGNLGQAMGLPQAPGTGGASPGGGSPVPGATGMAPGIGQADPDLVNRLPGPLKPLAPVFQDAGQKYGIDPKFLAAISMLETGKGTSRAFRQKNNAMGVSNRSGPIAFSNPAESIYRMARTLANRSGPYRGANTIPGIGRIYAPPGAANDPRGTNGHWATNVARFYRMLGGDPSQAVIRR